MASWGVAEAKARFSAVLDRAETEGPQLVRRRKQEFYVLTKEQWAARRTRSEEPPTKHRSMADFFRSSPLRGSGLEVTRSKSGTRKVRL